MKSDEMWSKMSFSVVKTEQMAIFDALMFTVCSSWYEMGAIICQTCPNPRFSSHFWIVYSSTSRQAQSPC